MYLAGFLRTLSIGLVGVFVPLYLLQNGYNLTDIFIYYACFYGLGCIFAYGTGHLIARFGPKHIMRVSFMLQVIFSFLLINIDSVPYTIFSLASVAALSSSMYFLSHHVDFSKVKHSEHGGKELGFLLLMERVGGVVGPIGGGLLATVAGPRATFFAAGVAMFIAVIILMLTPEPVQTHQKLNFKGLLKKNDWKNRLSYASLGVENAVSVWLWPVFLAAVVFTSNGYLNIGLVSSTSVLVAIIVAIPLGRLLDRQKGKMMIIYGTNVNSAIHIFRLFAASLPSSVVIAMFNEPNTLVYRMAYIKGYYDTADEYPGQRIAFIVINEILSNIARMALWLTLAALSLFFSAYVVCAIGFCIGALASQGIKLQKFKALR